MKAEFHYESEELTVSFRIPLADYQKLWRYQKQYPDAVLEGLEGAWEALEELTKRESILIRDAPSMHILQFLDSHLPYLCESEQTLYQELLKKAQTLTEAVELAVNLDCYQMGKDGRAEQKKAHTCPYSPQGCLPTVGRTGEHQMKAVIRVEGTYHWLYLPMTAEKKRFLEKTLSVENLEHQLAEPVTMKQREILSYLPKQAELAGLERLTALLRAREEAGKADWEQLCAAFSVERPETMAEVCQVVEKSTNYVLSREWETDQQYETPYGYLDLKGALPLHPLSREVVTSWIYGRLYGEIVPDEYEMEEPDVERLYGEDLSDWEAEIGAQVKQDQADMSADGGLAQYIHHALLRQKVRDVEVSVAVLEGALWSKTRVESYGALNQMETAQMKEYLHGQFADGWGEGFSQREISVQGAKLYLYFWHDAIEQDLYTEEELQELYAITPTMQLE